MAPADLDRVEAVHNLKLPAFYRKFMPNYPDWLAEIQPERLKPRARRGNLPGC